VEVSETADADHPIIPRSQHAAWKESPIWRRLLFGSLAWPIRLFIKQFVKHSTTR